jgi:hypothetical protein
MVLCGDLYIFSNLTIALVVACYCKYNSGTSRNKKKSTVRTGMIFQRDFGLKKFDVVRLGRNNK